MKGLITMDKRIKLFTHTDLDGVGCAILAAVAFENDEIEVVYCDYDSIDEEVKSFIDSDDVESFERCLITDIKIGYDLAKEIDEKYDNFTLLDHHPTADYLKEFEWCTIQIETLLDHDTVIKTSGTELLYEWLIDHGAFDGYILSIMEAVDNFVNIVRDYDTWRWASIPYGEISKNINDLYYIYGRDKFVADTVDKILLYKNFPCISDTDKLLLENKQKEIDNYLEQKNEQFRVGELNGRPCGVVFADKYLSEIGNKLCKLHPEVDFVLLIDMGRGGISFRADKDGIDLGKDFASLYGGGGHPKASGCPIRKIEVDELLKTLLEPVNQ